MKAKIPDEIHWLVDGLSANDIRVLLYLVGIMDGKNLCMVTEVEGGKQIKIKHTHFGKHVRNLQANRLIKRLGNGKIFVCPGVATKTDSNEYIERVLLPQWDNLWRQYDTESRSEQHREIGEGTDGSGSEGETGNTRGIWGRKVSKQDGDETSEDREGNLDNQGQDDESLRGHGGSHRVDLDRRKPLRHESNIGDAQYQRDNCLEETLP